MYWLAPYQLELHVREHQRRCIEDVETHNRAKAAKALRREQARHRETPSKMNVSRLKARYSKA